MGKSCRSSWSRVFPNVGGMLVCLRSYSLDIACSIARVETRTTGHSHRTGENTRCASTCANERTTDAAQCSSRTEQQLLKEKRREPTWSEVLINAVRRRSALGSRSDTSKAGILFCFRNLKRRIDNDSFVGQLSRLGGVVESGEGLKQTV